MSWLPRIGRSAGLAALVLFLCLPEAALLGYFTAGALLALPAEAPRSVDVVVVLGGGDGARYARGRDLVLAGYSKRLVLIEPTASELKDARDKVPGVAVWADVLPGNSWGEANATRARMVAAGWRWWRTPEATSYVGDEVLKLGYYVVKYRFGF